MTVGVVAAAVVLTSSLVAIAAIWLRLRAYRKRVFYDPAQHCVLGLDGVSTESVSLQYDSNSIVLPADAAGAVSGLLELDVQASFLGCLFDPAIEINACDFHDEQYFERGVQGRRFLNVSRLLKDSEHRGQISLSGHDIASSLRSARLHVCHEGIAADDRVLV